MSNGITAIIIIGFVLAGSVGAVSRYIVEMTIQRILGNANTLGTWVVNSSGAFFVGVLYGCLNTNYNNEIWFYIGIGFAGSYTTFSTWMLHVVVLMESGRWREALVLVLGSIVPGIIFTLTGVGVSTWLRLHV